MTGTEPPGMALDRLSLAVAASLLEQGRIIDGASRLVTAAALVGALLVGTTTSASTAVPMLAAIVLGLLQTWLAVRVGFDAALFSRLAAGPDVSTASFDAVMTGMGLLPPTKAGRAWSIRIAGARRLMLWQGAVVLAQVGGVVGGIVSSAGWTP